MLGTLVLTRTSLHGREFHCQHEMALSKHDETETLHCHALQEPDYRFSEDNFGHRWY